MTVAVAHPNIALVKYWGKRDARLNLPAVPSLSLTLGGWSTRTAVRWGGDRDVVASVQRAKVDTDRRCDLGDLSGDRVEVVERYADMIQIGARNMQNFELLKEVGAYDKPVLLKRGLSATIKEFLLSAEYIMSRGNQNVMLCERGIRTFETQYRNTLDLAAVPTLKELSHLPVIVDPSHATGKWNLVAPMSKAAVAAGADGILIEVHSNPECALCDGEESIKPSKFKELMHDMRKIAVAVGREL